MCGSKNLCRHERRIKLFRVDGARKNEIDIRKKRFEKGIWRKWRGILFLDEQMDEATYASWIAEMLDNRLHWRGCCSV